MSFPFTKWLQSNDVWLLALKQTIKQTLGSFLFVLNHLALSPSLVRHEHWHGRYTSESPLTSGLICGWFFRLLNFLIISKTSYQKNQVFAWMLVALLEVSCDARGSSSPIFLTQLIVLQLTISKFFWQIWNTHSQERQKDGISETTMNIWNPIACHHRTTLRVEQKIKLPFSIVPVAGRVILDKPSNFTQVIFLRPWNRSDNSHIFQPILKL